MDPLHLETRLDKLKCSVCNRFLSIFPIFAIKDKENKFLPICGRCRVPNNEETSRFEICENLIEIIKFPCIYHENGCMEKLLPEHMKQHEPICLYSFRNCYFHEQNNCEWRGCAKQLSEHCKSQHRDLWLEFDQFEFNLFDDYSTTHILWYCNKVFLFKCNFKQETNRLNCSLMPLDFDEAIKKYYVQINLTTTETTITKMLPEINFDINNWKSFDVFLHNMLNGNNAKVIGTIKIINGTEKFNSVDELNRKLTKRVKCFVCKCDEDCKNDNYICDDCTDNSELEVLDCYYCGFVFNDIEFLCAYCANEPIECILASQANCVWEISRSNLLEHLLQNHKQAIVNANEIIKLEIDLESDEQEITKYFHYYSCLFFLNVTIRGSQIYFFVGPIFLTYNASKFEYEIIFKGTENNVPYKFIFKDRKTMKLHEDHFRKFMSNGNLLCFKINAWVT